VRSSSVSQFPHAKRLSVPDAGHLLMVQNPTAVAQGLTEHFTNHPIGSRGTLTV
jgi:pimeloyl-ACP methyl ester carboxylesterase